MSHDFIVIKSLILLSKQRQSFTLTNRNGYALWSVSFVKKGFLSVADSLKFLSSKTIMSLSFREEKLLRMKFKIYKKLLKNRRNSQSFFNYTALAIWSKRFLFHSQSVHAWDSSSFSSDSLWSLSSLCLCKFVNGILNVQTHSISHCYIYT